MTGLEGLHKKAQKGIGKALEPGEEVLVAESGQQSALVATNKRIYVCKWGITTGTGAFFGSQVNSWDLLNVSGIEYRKGVVTKAIVIRTPGTLAVTKFGPMDKGRDSVWEAPNALFVKEEADETVGKLRQLVAKHQSPTAPAAAADPATQIRNLAALRDEGLLTSEEFEAKKRQILGM
jgi:hypothetical protein